MLLVVIALFPGAACLPAAEKTAPRRLYSLESDDFPLKVTGAEMRYNAAVLKSAEDSYRALLGVLGLGEMTGFYLQINWGTDEPPAGATPDTFARRVRLRDGKLFFQINGTGNPARTAVALARTCLTCFLQAMMIKPQQTESIKVLPEPPLWLTEGVLQMCGESKSDLYAAIGRRYAQTGIQPALAEVQSWDELDDYLLKRCWQQAFAWLLVGKGAETLSQKQTLALWLTSGDAGRGKPFLESNARNEAWWRSRLLAQTDSIKLYDREQTLAALNEVLQISLRIKGEKEDRVLSIRELPTWENLEKKQNLQSKSLEFYALQAKSDPVLHRMVVAYQAAFEAWARQNYRDYKERLEVAERMEKGIGEYIRRVQDYLDWITVNYPTDRGRAEFAGYRDLVDGLEAQRTKFRKEKKESERTWLDRED